MSDNFVFFALLALAVVLVAVAGGVLYKLVYRAKQSDKETKR